ncbi:MAG: tyrosine-type recombinase/integrase [Candidatus Margulisiibacteriota bacterium]
MDKFELEKLIIVFVDEYAVSRGLSAAWAKKIKAMCFTFVAWLRSTGTIPQLANLTPGVCRGYLVYLRGKYHNWTIRHHYIALKLFVDYLIDKGLLQTNPLKGIRAPTAAKKVPNIISDKEYADIIDSVQTMSAPHPFSRVRNRTFFRLWKVTGLRVGEMLNLKMDDFRLNDKNKSIQIWNGKRSRYDYLPLAGGVLPDIEEYLSARGLNHSPHFFLSATKGKKWGYGGVRRLFGRLKELGLLTPNITPHNFRATFCCNLLNKGVNVFEVQALMRHTSLQSTLFYVKNNPARLQEYVDKLL